MIYFTRTVSLQRATSNFLLLTGYYLLINVLRLFSKAVQMALNSQLKVRYPITLSVDMVNMLANSCLFTHLDETKQYWHSFGVFKICSL